MKRLGSAMGISALLVTLFTCPGSAAGRFDEKLSIDKQMVQILNRLTFGPRPGDLEQVRRLGVAKWIELQLDPDRITENPALEAKLTPLGTVQLPMWQILEKFPAAPALLARPPAASMAVLATIWFAALTAHAAELPGALSDQEFWRLVTELSEPGGAFTQELMSNEDSVQSVIPALKQTTRRGGVYLGVGPEQNFTYIAAIQPKLAFLVDIRRDNMLQHLMYKALFELSTDRADFLSRLFSMKRPPGLDARSSVTALFEAYQTADVDVRLYDDNLRAVTDLLTQRHKFQLSDADTVTVARLMQAFRIAGPNKLKGSGDKNLTYAQAMTATDLAGSSQSYLASEDNFRIVQDLERRNLIVPVVGDFAGDKALVSVGRYLEERDAIVNVFYVSNVERYLFEQGDHGRHFYANVAMLPLDQSSTFIRSVTRDISRRLGIPLPDGNVNWWSSLYPIRLCLDAVANGRVETYRQLFETAR